MIEKEIWKDVIGYEVYFMVSSYGRVWSKRSKRILKINETKSGYHTISTKLDGRKSKAITKKVHRWVCECFVDNLDNKPYVNHKNGNKADNYYKNLEWCTSFENTKHAIETGLIVGRCGTKQAGSKLTDENIEYIRKSYIPRCKTYGCRALADKFNVHHERISRIVNNKAWKHV